MAWKILIDKPLILVVFFLHFDSNRNVCCWTLGYKICMFGNFRFWLENSYASRKYSFTASLAKQTVSHYLESDHLYSRFKEKNMLWKLIPILFKRLVCVVFTAGIPAFAHTHRAFYFFFNLNYCELHPLDSAVWKQFFISFIEMWLE